MVGFKQSTKGMDCNGLQGRSQGEILNWIQTSINQSWTVSFHDSIFIFCPLPVVHIVFMGVQGQFVPPLALAVVAASLEQGDVLLIQDGWEMPAQLPACLLSSKHTHGLSQQAAATADSRDLNELAAFLQSPYLPPAAPRLPLPVSSLPAPVLDAPRQRERGIIYCVPVENERLLHFNEH